MFFRRNEGEFRETDRVTRFKLIKSGKNWLRAATSNFGLFKVVKEELGDLNIIAEDLGNIDDKTRKLLADCGYPGMKIVQFGFYDTTGNSIDIPHVYTQHSVAYTGTHDNMSMVEWYSTLNKNEKFICDENLKNFLKDYNTNIWEPIQWRAIEVLYASKSNRVIVPLQDILGLGADSRMNTPSTVGDNWAWRVYWEYRHGDLENKLYNLAKRYQRI